MSTVEVPGAAFTVALVALVVAGLVRTPVQSQRPSADVDRPGVDPTPVQIQRPSATLIRPGLVQLPLKASPVRLLTESVWSFRQVPLSVSVPLPLADKPTRLGR